MLSSKAQVEPLPLVPPTVTTGHEKRSPRARRTVSTRARPKSIATGCKCSRYRSQSESGAELLGRSGRREVANWKTRAAGPLHVAKSAYRRSTHEQGHQIGEPVTHLASIDDHVDRAVLGYHDIADHGETGRYTAHRRIGEHRDKRQPFGRQLSEGSCGLRHLHEGHQSFLHTRTAACSETHEWHLLLDRTLHTAAEALAHDRTHRPAHEAKLDRGDDRGDRMDRTLHHDQSVGFARLGSVRTEAIAVASTVDEFQKVDGGDFRADLVAPFGIESDVQSLAGGNPIVMRALWANAEALFEIRAVQYRFAYLALDPQTFGDRLAYGPGAALDLRRKQLLQPAHVTSDASTRRAKARDAIIGNTRLFVHRTTDPAEQRANVFDHMFRRRSFDFLHQPAADHDGIRELGYGSRGFAISDTKSDTDGQLDMRADLWNLATDLVEIEVARTRHAFERDIVDVAACDSTHLLDARRLAGGREQKNAVDHLLPERSQEISTLFRRIVHDEHAVHARLRRATRKGVHAHRFDGIGITHQHHRRVLVLLAKAMYHVQHTLEVSVLLECALACSLDRGSIGHGIGERHSQLDDVGTPFDQGMHQRNGKRQRGVTGGDEGNKRFAAARG